MQLLVVLVVIIVVVIDTLLADVLAGFLSIGAGSFILALSVKEDHHSASLGNVFFRIVVVVVFALLVFLLLANAEIVRLEVVLV